MGIQNPFLDSSAGGPQSSDSLPRRSYRVFGAQETECETDGGYAADDNGPNKRHGKASVASEAAFENLQVTNLADVALVAAAHHLRFHFLPA